MMDVVCIGDEVKVYRHAIKEAGGVVVVDVQNGDAVDTCTSRAAREGVFHLLSRCSMKPPAREVSTAATKKKTKASWSVISPFSY